MGPAKAERNFAKHRVRFAEAIPVFEDEYAIVIADDVSEPGESRLVAIGMGALMRVLVVVYCYRGEDIWIISARVSTARELRQYEVKR